MATLKVLDTTDGAEWREVLPADVNVFGSIEYARIREAHTGFQARLLVWTSSKAKIGYPFFLRPIETGQLGPISQTAWDTVSPEYTGPILLHGDHDDDQDVQAEITAHCRANGIVAEFAHLHPWQRHERFLDPAAINHDRQIVYVDLTLPGETLWNESLTYACRKNMRRAEKEKVKIFSATDLEHIAEFHRVYTATMERARARARYFFPLEYFQMFFEQMPDYAHFVLAEYRGQIAAGILFLHDGTDVYSYLGGTDHAFQRVRPTNAIIYDTICWARDSGKQRLILGGGYRPNDGIFRFKASFSPLRADFCVYKKVHLPDLYDALCTVWRRTHGSNPHHRGYFPAYRSLPPMR